MYISIYTGSQVDMVGQWGGKEQWQDDTQIGGERETEEVSIVLILGHWDRAQF